MPIVWRLGTGRTYLDYPRGRDLATVAAMGTAVVPLLTCWMEEDCKIMREGAAATLARLAPMAVPPGGLAAELATLI